MRNSSLALVALVTVVAALSVASTSSSSSSISRSPVLKTRGYVQQLAADGNQVAAATTTEKVNTCDRIVIWSPAKKTSSHIRTGVNCETSSAVNNIPEIALAGKRVAWVEASGGNYLELALISHTLGQKKSRTVFFATNGNAAAEDPGGGYVQNLFGNGNLIAFNTWSQCTEIPAGWDWEDAEKCADPAPGDQPVTMFNKQALLEIVNGKGVEIASAPDSPATGLGTMSLTVVAVNAGRVATQQPSGAVAIYAAGGAILQTIPIPSGKFAGFALQGSQLVTIRDGNLELYDVNTGTLTSTKPLAAGAVLRDLRSGLAVYIAGRKVHVLRLEDGKDIVYAPLGKGVVDARLASSGLYYSYNFPGGLDRGRVAFVPFAKVLQRLG